MLFLSILTLVAAKSAFLAIGILSNASNFEHRQAIRDSWLKHAPTDDAKWTFIVGKAGDSHIDERVKEEHQKYQDLLILESVPESYRGIVAKTRAAFQWAFDPAQPNEFLLKCDDDSYVRVHAFVTQLKHLVDSDPDHAHLYMGDMRWNAEPIRDPNHKWFVSHESWTSEKFPPYALGSGYVVGKGVGMQIVQAKEIVEQEIPIEDVTVGIWMQRLEKDRQQKINYKYDGRFKAVKSMGWNPEDLLWHQLTPEEMKSTWSKFH